MAFTLAHPAVAVPIARLAGDDLDIPALVIGSMAPDIEFVLTGRATSKYGHSAEGLLLFCMPVGLSLYLLYHLVAKRPLVLLLPDRYRDRLIRYAHPPEIGEPARLARAAISVYLGAVTHVAWDAFSHPEGIVVRGWPALRVPLMRIGGMRVAGYKLVQYFSSLAGLVVMARGAERALRSEPRVRPPKRFRLPRALRRAIVGALGLVTGAMALRAGLRAARGSSGLAAVEHFITHGSIYWMGAAGLGVLAYGTAARLHLESGSEPYGAN